MPDFTPLTVHESLDYDGLLDDAHGPGCYALRLDVPDSIHDAHARWREYFDALPGDDAVTRMAQRTRVAYVGASGDVYDRLMDHAEAQVRKAAVLRPFLPLEVIGVYPSEDPFRDEVQTARDLGEDGWLCWVNGEVV